MKNIYKNILLCVFVSILSGVGNILGNILLKQLIDAPKSDLVIALAFLWIACSFITVTKNYILQRHYLNEQKVFMSSLLESIFAFPLAYLESKKYYEKYEQVKDKVSQEQAYISSVERISLAAVSVLGLYILLWNQISAYILAILTGLLLLVLLLSGVISSKFSFLMYDYWKNYIKNTRKYNYISNVMVNKEYIEEKKVYDYRPFFEKEFEKEYDFASKKIECLEKKELGWNL